MTDIAEIDRRMQNWRAFLQPHFDRMALPQDKQAAHYESLRQGIPEAMAKESRGEAWWQIANAQQKRLETPYQLSEREFNEILLPSLLHIGYMPDTDAMSLCGNTLRTAMFLCASTDWQDRQAGMGMLDNSTDGDYVSGFIHIAADNYRVLMACERESINHVRALYIKPACAHCQEVDSETIDTAQLLAAIRSGIYPFAHVITEGDEAAYICPGPKLMILDNRVDPVKLDVFMAGVRDKMAKYQAEAAAKLREER